MRLVFGNDPAKQIKRNRLAGSGRRLGDVEGWVEPPKEQQDRRGSRSSRVSLCFTYNHNKLEPRRLNVNIAPCPAGTWPSAEGEAGTDGRGKRTITARLSSRDGIEAAVASCRSRCHWDTGLRILSFTPFKQAATLNRAFLCPMQIECVPPGALPAARPVPAILSGQPRVKHRRRDHPSLVTRVFVVDG